MKPTMGRIVHVWDPTYNKWFPGIVLGDYGKNAFSVQVFRGFDMVERTCYFNREGQEVLLGGWRWPPLSDKRKP